MSTGQNRTPDRDDAAWEAARQEMLATIRRYGVRDTRVLDAMAALDRALFFPGPTPEPWTVYGDYPTPIGWGQTISQPFVVAHMTSLLNPLPGERILEIGAGSGYEAAVLALLGAEVHSVEIVPELADHARKALATLGVRGVEVHLGNGWEGYAEAAPYDAAILSCAPPEVPETVLDQVRTGGRVVAPVGRGIQYLVRLVKEPHGIRREECGAVRFVPMVRHRGEA